MRLIDGALRHVQEFMFDKMSSNLSGFTFFFFSVGSSGTNLDLLGGSGNNRLSHNWMFNPTVHQKSYRFFLILAMTVGSQGPSLMESGLPYLLSLKRRRRGSGWGSSRQSGFFVSYRKRSTYLSSVQIVFSVHTVICQGMVCCLFRLWACGVPLYCLLWWDRQDTLGTDFSVAWRIAFCWALWSASCHCFFPSVSQLMKTF